VYLAGSFGNLKNERPVVFLYALLQPNTTQYLLLFGTEYMVQHYKVDKIKSTQSTVNGENIQCRGLWVKSINQSKCICIVPYAVNESEVLHDGRD